MPDTAALPRSRLPAAMLERLALPVIAAPMFLVSGPALVEAACRAGIVGALPAANARSSEILDAWLTGLTASLARAPEARIGPWAVNLVAHRSNARLQADLALCVRHRAPIVITALGGSIEEVMITEMKEHTYFAVLKIRVGDTVHEIDCRPSDAIAMAVHYSPILPIYVAEQVLNEVG